MTKRTQASALTIAYMAIGAQRALSKYHEEQPDKLSVLVESHGGQLNIMDEVIGYALMADMVGDYIDALELQDGVWCYDVEVFGFDLIANHFEPLSQHFVGDILLDSLSSNGQSRTVLKGALGGLPSQYQFIKGI